MQGFLPFWFKGLEKLQWFFVQGFAKITRFVQGLKKLQGFFKGLKKMQGFFKGLKKLQGFFKGLKKLQEFLVQIARFLGSRMCFDKKFKSF